jgi:hypothetical protein
MCRLCSEEYTRANQKLSHVMTELIGKEPDQFRQLRMIQNLTDWEFRTAMFDFFIRIPYCWFRKLFR